MLRVKGIATSEATKDVALWVVQEGFCRTVDCQYDWSTNTAERTEYSGMSWISTDWISTDWTHLTESAWTVSMTSASCAVHAQHKHINAAR
jgi:hypothetical protein